MGRNLRKNSSISEYIRDIEERFDIDSTTVGKVMVSYLRARALAPNGSALYSPEDLKFRVIDGLSEHVRKMWISLKFGKFDDEKEIETYRFTEPEESTLEGSIERLREITGDEQMFHYFRDAVLNGADHYYATADIPYTDQWKIYDLIRAEVVRMIRNQEKQIDEDDDPNPIEVT